MSKRTKMKPERAHAIVSSPRFTVEFDLTPECYVMIDGIRFRAPDLDWNVTDDDGAVVRMPVDRAWVKFTERCIARGRVVTHGRWLALTEAEAGALSDALGEYDWLKKRALIARLEKYITQLREKYGE